MTAPAPLRVYGASNICHFKTWLSLRELWPEVQWTARWPDGVAQGIPDTPENAAKFWVEDQEDVVKADAVLVLASPPGVSPLRGALVEAGMGLALGKRVFLVGQDPQYGTWQFHPSVVRCPTLVWARQALRAFALRGA